MKRRREDAPPVRVYTYGLPLGHARESAERVELELRRGHEYHNDMIMIEQWRRIAYAALVAEAGDIAAIDTRIAEMEASLSEIRATIKRASADARKRVNASPAQKEQIDTLRAALKAARGERKVARKALNDPRIAECNHRANEMVKLFRKASKLRPSGTYLKIEDAVKDTRTGPPPRFRRWDGSGRIVIQTKELTPSALLGAADNRIRVDVVDDPRTKPDRVFCELSIRIQGEWAVFPMIMHRPIPADAVIKWAWIQRRRVGERFRWELQLALEARSFAPQIRKGHTVAVSVSPKGARGGRCVALAVGTNGATHVLALEPSVPGALEHADGLRAVQDKNFNAARGALVEWLANNDPPEWLAAELSTLPQWKSPRRLVRVAWMWSRQRFEGDSDIFATIEAWRRQHRHLYQWEQDERGKALRRRREGARVWAAKLAREYAILVTEDIDFAKAKRNAAPEADAEHAKRDHVHRTLTEAAPGEARDCVRAAFAGRETRIKPAARGTLCPVCGGSAVTGDYELACTACEARVDADYARCWHMLRDTKQDTSRVAEGYAEMRKTVDELKGREARR